MSEIQILDACCGGKMFWFDKHEPHTTYLDNRSGTFYFPDRGQTRSISVEPTVVGDFRRIPFDDKTFDLVVFDPPHLLRAGKLSWLRAKYGILPKDWKSYIWQGMMECLRVLKTTGVLIFKWSDNQISFKDVLKILPKQPIFGDKRGHTRWFVIIPDQHRSGDLFEFPFM